MALPPNGWPDNGPLHSTRERERTIPMLTAFHAKCRGSYHRLQSGKRSWLDSQTRHAYMRKNICYRTQRHRQNQASLAGIYLPSWLSTARGPRGTSTKNHFRPPTPMVPTDGGQRQSSNRQRADSSSILNLADRVPVLRFQLCEKICFRVKSFLYFRSDICSHDINKDKLK